MSLEHHPLTKEFPEYHEQIHHLKLSDNHFHRLMDEYENLDKEIYRIESDEEPADDQYVNKLKSKRVALKDQLHRYMKQ